MIAISFLAFVGFAALVSLSDWRRGWLFAVLAGVAQDPIRKLTPGNPVLLSMSVVAIFAMIIVAHQARLRDEWNDFTHRFPSLWSAFGLVLFCLALATVNGIATFGLSEWKAPMLSLFTYLAPIPAILFGYMYLDREERIYQFFRFYAVVTSLALVGSILEYFRVDSAALGMVSQEGDYIRHLPGIQIRMISGFYRGPDIMACHAATLTAISIAAVVRSGLSKRSSPWMFAAGWGFFNCLISGRRKAIYTVAVFAAVFILRQFRRLRLAEVVALALTASVIGYIVHDISSNEKTSMYARGATATQEEFAKRLEGGLFGTIAQQGFIGAGLGSATQGVYHVIADPTKGSSWQEGGLGKLAIEVGVPGLLAFGFFGIALLRMMLRIAAYPEEPASSQMVRATLFALVVANVANFVASAQTYSDPLLALLAAFFLGCLLATAALEDRTAPSSTVAPSLLPARA